MTRGNGFIFSLSGKALPEKEWGIGLHFARFCWNNLNPSRIPAKIVILKAGTPKADVVVRIARSIVQVECLNSSVAAIVPITATNETGPLLIATSLLKSYHNENFLSQPPQIFPNSTSLSLAVS